MAIENIDISKIKTKLSLFGITFENYKETTGHLVGVVKIPSSLFVLNPKLNVEEAFYLIANSIFEVTNLLCLDVPNQFECNWKETVGEKIFNDFKLCIFEEVKQRFLSNKFPEFQNADTLIPNTFNISEGGTIGGNIHDYLNDFTKTKLCNIDWLSIDIDKQYDPNFVNKSTRLYVDMSNLNRPTSTQKQIHMTAEDGSFSEKPITFFAKQDDVVRINTSLLENVQNIAKNTSDINIMKPILDNAATKKYVDQSVAAIPKVEAWSSAKIYNRPQFVTYDGRLWFALKDNNLNHPPGGIDRSWWTQIIDIVENRSGEIVYSAGTDIREGLTCPNSNFYINIFKYKDFVDENELFLELQKEFTNLTLNDVKNFITNFCGSIEDLEKTVNRKLAIHFPGEIKIFFAKPAFENYANEKFLNNNFRVDYIFLEDKRFLFHKNEYSDGPVLGGDNYIYWKNLPNDYIEIRGQTDSSYVNTSWISAKVYTGGIGNSYDPATKKAPGFVFNGWDDNRVVPFSNRNLAPMFEITNSMHYHDIRIPLQLNRSGAFEPFIPKYQAIFAVQFLKFIYPKNAKLWVNIFDIQSYYTKTQNSLVLDSYYKKIDVDNLLKNKLDALPFDSVDQVVFSNGGQAKVEELYNKTFLDGIINNSHLIDKKMSNNLNDWDEEFIRALAQRLKIHMN